MSEQGGVILDLTLPVVVHLSLSEDTECTLLSDGDNDDSVFYWQIPHFMTDSLFCDFLCEIVDAISNRDTEKFLELLQPSPVLEKELQILERRRIKWFRATDDQTNSRIREIVQSSGDLISLYPTEGTIRSIDVLINNDTDSTGKLRRNLNQAIAEDIAFHADLEEVDDEMEDGQDITMEDKYASDEEEEINEEIQANPEKPCYYPSQIEMAAILKKRIDTIMSHYHNISSLSEVFNDVEFVVYTARYRMLSNQTEKRICHPNAGVLSKEELKSRDGFHGKKRIFMYVHSTETEKHFQELKRDVQKKPSTLFVIIADECHWGITKDKEEKPSAHNLFINEWCKDESPQNVVVLQISATPFNLLTQNSRLPEVRCSLLNNEISTARSDYQAGDLVVLEREPDLEEHVKNNSKEVELHVVHWSEVELKNFERGMRMKLKSTLNNNDSPYQYLQVSTDGMLAVTSTEVDANEFIVQGSNGIVNLKVLSISEQQQAKPLTVSQDVHGNLVAKVEPPNPTRFEVKLEFGVGVLAFRSCESQNHYIAVDQHGYVSLKPAKVERKCGVSIMKPPPEVARVSSVSYQFFIDRCGPAEVDLVGQEYMSLNFYLSTMNSSNKNEQKVREDDVFQKIVDKAKRQKKMSKIVAPSFSVDALLCSEYCYYILLAGVYHSEEKIRQALTSSIDESPVAEFDRKVHSLVSTLKKETTNSTKYIEPEAFEFVRKGLCDKATDDFKENLKKSIKILSRRNSATGNQEKVKEMMKDLSSSFVVCLMHLPPNKLQKLMEDSRSFNPIEEIKQRLKENDCREMIQKWTTILQEGETSFLVENLIRSGKGEMGRMKIVRAKSMKTADQFYFTLRLTRSISSLEECFEVIRDYGGIQIEKQLMKSSSPFFKKLQPEICADKFDCPCPGLELKAGRKKCAKCHHVHKSITQYEDLENLACVLILVEKGRMGDTFPQSFDCLDLRLSHDSSWEFKEGSSLHLSTIIQELGRMCRYSKSSAIETPYVLVGRVLFKTLQTSLETSPSMNAISCQKADRYMTKSRRRKDEKCSSLRWLDYEAQKDSYDYQNTKKHCNRILLHAEPQIGKTGAYLCLIRELRRDIFGNVSLSATPAFEEGIFYRHKQNHYSHEFLVRDTGERHNWEYPYWKTIKDSPSLYDEPVASGKYSIEGCFYTHDVEECLNILINPEQDKKAIHHQYQERECTEGLRAWHWYHFEKCVDCGRLLQVKGPALETFKVSIDGIPVTVRCSVPSSHQSFKHLLERLKSTSSTEEAAKELNPLSSPFWIFHASNRDDPRKCTLNYHHVMQEKGQVPTYAQIAVVRKDKFDAYRSTWGKVLTIVQLPDALPNYKLGPNEGGVGYARLFIQKLSFALNLEYIFVIDDNVVVMSEAVFIEDPSSPTGGILREEKGAIKMQHCSFLKPLSHLQKIAEGKELPPIDETTYDPHPLTDQFESQEFPLYSYTGPAKLFGDKQHESYGVLGLIRSVPVAVTPFSRAQVYAAVLLNVKSTVEKSVFYRPWPCWEDLRFNDDCDKAGLWVVKCNRYSFLKVQYKDWINSLAPPRIFEWRNDSILEERPLVSELPKNFEESIILEHLRNFVNTQGAEKCFKGCLGYEQQEDIENTVCPTRIVQNVQAKEATEEDFTNGVPVVILSFSATNSERKKLSLLDKTFCRTKENIIFVASAEEAIEEWPQMSLVTVASKKGICFCSEMGKRNAKFSILSAADPKRHRLRYVLIQASFPQDDKDYHADVTSIVENSPLNITNETRMDRISLPNNTQPICKEKKSMKRSLRESLHESVEMKRRKTNDDCNHNQRLESLLPERCDDVIIIEELFSPLQSRPKHFRNVGTKSKRAKAVVGQLENKSKAVDLIRIDSMDSVHAEEEMASEKMDFSNSVQETSKEVDRLCQVSIVSEDEETLGRKRVARNDDPRHMEGTNDVTKDIVSLWWEFRNLQTSSAKEGETTGSKDLTMTHITEKLARFTTDQLQAKDEKGFNALLKACSLPSMSPHVLQYLITTRKVDINCELSQDFDRNPSTAKGLIPGMSALSVAIKRGNVKLVPTFTRRGSAISVQSVDDDGNTALHHCVLKMSKFSFRKLFPLFKPLKWKKMRNNDGKNPLDIARGMQGLSKGRERSIKFMCEEMMKKKTTKTKMVEEKK